MSRRHLVVVENTENQYANTPVCTAVPGRRSRAFSGSQAFADVLHAGLEFSGKDSQKTFSLICVGAPPSLRPGQAVLPQVVIRWKV